MWLWDRVDSVSVLESYRRKVGVLTGQCIGLCPGPNGFESFETKYLLAGSGDDKIKVVLWFRDCEF